MKKIASFLAFLALGISVSAKSWTNYAGFGWRIPTAVKVQSDDSNGKDIKFKTQTGLSLDYAGVHENGFSLRGIFDINYSGSDIEVGSDKDEMEGANCLFLVGAGYAPIHTEKMFLGFYGMLGADATVLNYEETVSVGGYSNSYEVMFHTLRQFSERTRHLSTAQLSISRFSHLYAQTICSLRRLRLTRT